MDASPGSTTVWTLALQEEEAGLLLVRETGHMAASQPDCTRTWGAVRQARAHGGGTHVGGVVSAPPCFFPCWQGRDLSCYCEFILVSRVYFRNLALPSSLERHNSCSPRRGGEPWGGAGRPFRPTAKMAGILDVSINLFTHCFF